MKQSVKCTIESWRSQNEEIVYHIGIYLYIYVAVLENNLCIDLV